MHTSRVCHLAVGAVLASVAAGAVAQQSYVLQASRWGEAQQAAVEAAGGRVTFAHDATGVAVAESANPQFLAQALSRGAIQSGAADMVVQWTPNVRTYDLQQDGINAGNDTLYPLQWAPQAVGAPKAWAMGYDGSGVRVAVIDGGVFSAHPDLAANLDTAAARSFATGPTPCHTQYNCDLGTFWHGTHVAGIIAAVDNTTGVVGIAPKATIVPVKALHGGSGSFGDVIRAIVYAATDGRADIINMSLGAAFNRGDRDAAELVSAMNRAVNFATRQGVLVVSSAGNDAFDLDHTGNLITVPAQSGNGLAILATGPLGWALPTPLPTSNQFSRPASYTNYGTSAIWVAAPGGDFAYPGTETCTKPTTVGSVRIPCWAFDMVLSTSRAGYTWSAGTSMAAPAASAVAALIKQRFPGISVGELKTRLAQSADDVGKPGADPFSGRGFINAYRAVTY